MSMWTRIRNGLKPDPDSGLGGATEGDLQGLDSDIIQSTGGVVDLAGGEALVEESAVPAMTVEVADGRIYIPNSSYDPYDSDSVKFWQTVLSNQSAIVIAANSSGSTRIDLICAKLDTTIVPDEFASNIATIVRVAGTPGAGVPATPANHYKLAEVSVSNGETAINTVDITDRRAQIELNEDMLPAGAGGDVSSDTSSSVDSELALFKSTTGKLIKRATLSGIAKLTSGVLSVVTAPSGTIVGTTDTQTMTNKRRTRRAVVVTQAAAPAMNTDNMDVALITALAQAITSMTTNLTGTPAEGDLLEVQITDNGTARAITWGASFAATTVALPTTTVISTKLRVLFEWNATTSKWDCVGVA